MLYIYSQVCLDVSNDNPNSDHEIPNGKLKSLINIGGIRFDSAELLTLAIASSFFEEHIETVGIFIPLDGKLFSLKLPKNIKEIANHILKIAKEKL